MSELQSSKMLARNRNYTKIEHEIILFCAGGAKIMPLTLVTILTNGVQLSKMLTHFQYCINY